MAFSVQQTYDQISAGLLTRYVILEKLTSLSESQFYHL